MTPYRLLSCLVVVLTLSIEPLSAAEKYITLASTTSTQNSGLFAAILPAFKKFSGIEVRVVAVGTGAAIRIARNGDADVLLVHHRASEEKFVAEGYGTKRIALMYNDFVLVGPTNGPAEIDNATSIGEALRRISGRQVLFVSRSDDSGTHKRERELWLRSGVDPKLGSNNWYREIGAGMGAALNMASAQHAYTLSDRGTWLSFKNNRDLIIVHEGDQVLRNVYGIIPLSKLRHPHVKSEAAKTFVDWLTSAEGQRLIAAYKINGEQLFYPLVYSSED